MAKLFGVGVGPGDPDLITLKAVKAIEACAVVAAPKTKQGSTLALNIASAHIDMSNKRVLELEFAMKRDRATIASKHEAAAQQIIAELERGYDVALLNLGDVSLYATFHYLKPLIEDAGFETVMISGIPAFSAIAATLGLNLTPDMDSPVHIIPAASSDLEAILQLPGTKVIMKVAKNIENLRKLIAELDLKDNVYLVSNCGLEDEKIFRDLNLVTQELTYFSTLVVLP